MRCAAFFAITIVAGCYSDDPSNGRSSLRSTRSTQFETSDEDQAKPSPSPPPIEDVFLSDLPFVESTNGFGPVERDKSNGEEEAEDGAPISIGGKIYEKGLGVHSLSEVTFDLEGRYKRFISAIGIDDEVPTDQGSVVFQVFVDETKVFESPVMTRASEAGSVNVSVENARTLRLVVTDAWDGITHDHADWAGARLVQ